MEPSFPSMRSSHSQPVLALSALARGYRPRLYGVAVSLVTATLLIGASSRSASAGTVLLARDSFIHATGSPGAFDKSDGTTEFGRFANDINSNDDGGSSDAFAEAHQNSQPGMLGSIFQGAFAEGSVQATTDISGAKSTAESTFDLTFQVTGAPQEFSFGAAMGTTGAGTAMAELLPLAVGAGTSEGPAAIFQSSLAPGLTNSGMLDKDGVLMPGTYTLKVHSDTGDGSGDASSYFNISLTLTDALVGESPSPSPAPLPPGAWTGLGVLLAVCPMLYLSQRRRALGPTRLR